MTIGEGWGDGEWHDMLWGGGAYPYAPVDITYLDASYLPVSVAVEEVPIPKAGSYLTSIGSLSGVLTESYAKAGSYGPTLAENGSYEPELSKAGSP